VPTPTAPVEAIVVVPVLPNAAILALRFDDEALDKVESPVTPMVEEKVMAPEYVCAPAKVPLKVPPPLALSEPPTLSNDDRVVEPVTANVPVLVAPVVVRPPLKATSVEVAPAGNGYVNGSVPVVR